MKDRRGDRPFVEDPRFLASLNDLDNGLDVDGLFAVRPRPPEPPAERPRAPAFRVPAPSASNDPAIRHRPLLDLFPPSALQRERPPGPILGTAVGPRLPGVGTLRHRADAEPFPRTGPLTYEAFYGLREKPFGLSTEPKFFFHSSAHERVAVQLLTAIRQHDGFCLLTGELGVGKTTLCRAIVGELDRGIASSIVLEPIPDADALLKIVIVDFGLSRDDPRRAARTTREEQLHTLASFFDSLATLSSAVVVLDEAHRQPPAVIAQLLALATGAGAGRLQVVLVGPPSFAATLKAPALRALDSVMTARCELGPLAADEIGRYVLHRLAVAGTSPRVDFEEAALQRIYELSRGVPSLVNVLCDGALAGGFRRSASTIDVALVNAAALALDVLPPAAMEPQTVRPAIAAAALLALMLLGAAGAVWVFRDAVARTIASWESVPPAPRPPARRVTPQQLAPTPPPQP